MKPKPVPDVKERVILSEKREEVLNEFKTSNLKWNTIKKLCY